jgi:hypothetical protein
MNHSDVYAYTQKDRSHWLVWLLGKRRLAERWGCPEFLKPGAAEAEATRVLQDLGFVPPGEIEACEGADGLLLQLEEDCAYPLRWWTDPQDVPPASLVGDYVDKCMVGIVPVDALAPRWDCAVLVTDEQCAKRSSERSRRGGLASLEYAWLTEDQPPGCDYEPEVTEDDLLDEALYIRQIEDADDPGDLAEAIREYGHWKGQGDEGAKDDYDPMEDEDASWSEDELVVPAVQFPAWLSGQMAQEVQMMLDGLMIQERLGNRGKGELHEGLSAALTIEWLLLLAEHPGDWSAAALGYFKCLERVLAASLRSACNAEHIEALEKKGMGAYVTTLFVGAADVLSISVAELVREIVGELREQGGDVNEAVACDLEMSGKKYASNKFDGRMLRAGRLWWDGVLGCASGPISRASITNVLRQLSVARVLRNKVAHVTPVSSDVVRFVRGLLIGPFSPRVNAERPMFGVSSGFLAVVSGGGVDNMRMPISVAYGSIRLSDVWNAWSKCYLAFLIRGGWMCQASRSTVWVHVQECDLSVAEGVGGFCKFAAVQVARLLRDCGNGMGLGSLPESAEWDPPDPGLGELPF